MANNEKSTSFVLFSWTFVKIIATKFHEDWTKNVDFLIRANFWKCLVFCYSDLIIKKQHFFQNFFDQKSQSFQKLINLPYTLEKCLETNKRTGTFTMYSRVDFTFALKEWEKLCFKKANPYIFEGTFLKSFSRNWW